jgi:hypothetical protein
MLAVITGPRQIRKEDSITFGSGEASLYIPTHKTHTAAVEAAIAKYIIVTKFLNSKYGHGALHLQHKGSGRAIAQWRELWLSSNRMA